MLDPPNSPPFAKRRSGIARWWIALAAAVVLSSSVLLADWWPAAPPDALAKATHIGRQACIECHQQEHEDWLGSHHDLAMDLATETSVLADFNNTSFTRHGLTTRFFRAGERFMVHTEGPDGKLTDFEVKYTFGVDPLQQYMVEFPDGRVQVLRVSWDTNRKQWFEVTPPDVPDERLAPDDPLHWTGIGQNWNSTCAECHSTNLQKNYDLTSDTYRTTYSEIDVSCEECHGPASLHVQLAKASSLFWDRRHGYGLAKLKGEDSTAQIETCAKCHSRRAAVHANFRPGTNFLNSYLPSLLDEGLYFADGQILDEVYVYGSFLQSKMHAKGVRCTDCHQPHSLKLKFTGNALCTQCHEPAKYDLAAHHHHPITADGVGNQCVDCHMPATTYMNVDPRRDHSFRVPRPDLSVAVGTPNACNGCHTEAEQDAAWAADKVLQWYGEQRPDDPHWAPAIAAGRAGEPAGEQLLLDLIRRESTPVIVRATAIDLLSRYASPAAREEIHRHLNSSQELVRITATRSATVTTAEELVGALAQRLTDPSRGVRTEASRRLAGAPAGRLTRAQTAALNSGITAYRAAQVLQAEYAAGHLNLADIASRQGDAATAILELRTAIRLEPYLTGPRSQLALELSQRAGDPAEVRQLRLEEIDNLRRDVGLLPHSAATQYRLGLMLYLVGQLEAAEAALEEACSLAPQNFDFRLALALLQERQYETSREQAQFDSAVASLRELEKLSPQDPRATAILKRMLANRADQQ